MLIYLSQSSREVCPSSTTRISLCRSLWDCAYVHSDEVPGTDCPIPSAPFIKNQKHMKYYFPAQILILAGFSPDTVPSCLLSTDASCSLSVLALPAFYTHSLFSYSLDLQWKSWSISSRSVKWLQQKKKKWCKRRIRAAGSVFWTSYFT